MSLDGHAVRCPQAAEHTFVPTIAGDGTTICPVCNHVFFVTEEHQIKQSVPAFITGAAQALERVPREQRWLRDGR